MQLLLKPRYFIPAFAILLVWALAYFLYIFASSEKFVIPPYTTVTLAYRNVELHADIYSATVMQDKPKVVIALHSSNAQARKMPFMQVLSAKLSAHAHVINADLRGFGDSVLSYNIETKADLDFAADLRQWIEYARKHYAVADEDIMLLGRATGAAVIIQYLHRYPHSKHKIVLICPPRGTRINEEILQKQRPFILRRWEKGMPGEFSISIEALRAVVPEMQPSTLPAIQHDRDISIFDTPRTMDVEVLRQIYAKLQQPKQLQIASQHIDHYYGTNNYINRILRTTGKMHYVYYNKNDFAELYMPLAKKLQQ